MDELTVGSIQYYMVYPEQLPAVKGEGQAQDRSSLSWQACQLLYLYWHKRLCYSILQLLALAKGTPVPPVSKRRQSKIMRDIKRAAFGDPEGIAALKEYMKVVEHMEFVGQSPALLEAKKMGQDTFRPIANNLRFTKPLLQLGLYLNGLAPRPNPQELAQLPERYTAIWS